MRIMEVYVEYVLLNNFAVNYLIAYLTVKAVKGKCGVLRLILASLIGAGFSLIYPYVERFGLIIKILLSAVMVLCVTTEWKFKRYLLNLGVFYLITLVFAGASLFIGDILGSDTLLPFAVSAGILLSVVLLEAAIRALYKRKKSENFKYRVELSAGGTTKEYVGYYDSGNKLYYNGKLPVIIIPQRLQEELGLLSMETIAVGTVGGVKELPLAELTVKIYLEGGANKIYHTRAAISDSYAARDADLILHRDMGGIDD